MSQPFRATLLLALTLVVAACGDRTDSGVPPAPKEVGVPSSQAPSLEAVRRHARGFDTGNQTSARQLFVFFDSRCASCALDAAEAKKLEATARLTWVPVSDATPEGLAQAAAILASVDPVAVLRGETSVDADAITDPGAVETVRQNNRVLASFGVSASPYLVGLSFSTGKVFTSGKAMTAGQLEQALGWVMPDETAQPAPGMHKR